jgi:hypothetical protein
VSSQKIPKRKKRQQKKSYNKTKLGDMRSMSKRSKREQGVKPD